MSYDVHVNCHTCGEDLNFACSNMTSNVAPVWDELGCRIRDWGGKSAVQVLPMLQNAISRYENMLPFEREELDGHKRGDGSWGKAEDAVKFIRSIRDACCRDPFATVSVSH